MLQEIIKQDTFDQEQTPAMLQLETGTASHSAFCFAMAVNHNNQMQFAVLGANDSTLKSFRAPYQWVLVVCILERDKKKNYIMY